MGERARGRPHSGRFIVSPCRRYFPQSLPLSLAPPSQSIDLSQRRGEEREYKGENPVTSQVINGAKPKTKERLKSSYTF